MLKRIAPVAPGFKGAVEGISVPDVVADVVPDVVADVAVPDVVPGVVGLAVVEAGRMDETKIVNHF